MSKFIQKRAAEQLRNDDESNPLRVSKRKVEHSSEKSQTKSKKEKLNDSNSKKSTTPVENSCAIYLGHIPHGFYEAQIKDFFTQFGTVRKVKLYRSAKTGGSKGYAFVQFESVETAEIVADAMNGYFLHDRQLVSHVIPKGKHHDGMWKTKMPVCTTVVNSEDDKKLTVVDQESKILILKKKMAEKQSKLNELGIDFQIPALEL